MVKNQIENIRHSLAHLLGAAVLELYPKSKLAIGPSVENGFYYDIDVAGVISDNDLPKIGEKMLEILKTWKTFEGQEVSASKAKDIFTDNLYKKEIIDELSEKGEKITLYTSGSFTDLCRGGHVENTKDIKPNSFKLSHVAGAYWRGNEKNPQLTRIYGLAFATKDELQKHLVMLEEAKKRDHKKLGIELDLFTFSDLVGPGLPLWTPKGTLLRDTLDNFVWELRKEYDYQRVDIPHITKKDLYEKSGHWNKFEDELFKIITREEHLFAIKPMNCPHHVQIYARKPWSYRELPQRYTSTTKCYRDEQSGELSGLARVRAFTQDDAHVFCRISQSKEEIQKIWEIVHAFYGTVGLKLRLRLSLRDPNHPEEYLGDKSHWNKAEEVLREVANENKTKFFEAPGEAAFYAPKLDFMATDSLGREWQVATIQLDVSMPESFDLTCINEKGEKERIVMIHAAIMGSIERFLSIVIEHYAGAFPVWLSPVQAIVLPISDNQNEWAEKVYEELRANDIRVEINKNNETLGKKIREAEMQKIPYLLVIGDKEVKAKSVAVRKRGEGDTGQIEIKEFLKKIKKEIETKKS
ncbi:MAG TPA: threonine--tRNA ligase [Candidatus Paceibacterota bacterium]